MQVKVDAHSEVMSHYPWAWTTPNAGDANVADTGAYADGTLVFADTVAVGSNARPVSGETGRATPAR